VFLVGKGVKSASLLPVSIPYNPVSSTGQGAGQALLQRKHFSIPTKGLTEFIVSLSNYRVLVFIGVGKGVGINLTIIKRKTGYT